MKQREQNQTPKKENTYTTLLWCILIVILLNWLIFPGLQNNGLFRQTIPPLSGRWTAGW